MPKKTGYKVKSDGSLSMKPASQYLKSRTVDVGRHAYGAKIDEHYFGWREKKKR